MSEWIEWKGGECPVSQDTAVSVRLENGEVLSENAKYFQWDWDEDSWPIVAYRLLGKVKQETPLEDEYTGGSSSYYTVSINNPTTKKHPPYIAECNDIIEALGMNYAEGNIFKAVWRRAAARTLSLKKKGYTDGLYDAEKVVFFGERLVEQERQKT